ncbi:hypothetical protein GCM10010472_19020 [Pseudonocardia halophobica]|uniref:Uncharacterized protein n=1 Tax=Pseudonocardia halophobica TaxID=29401 RepID=A0A9W6NUK1_9PSEU|nr:hypothetical protein GCM10017577_10240 [Pseudonocardia halophobica]
MRSEQRTNANERRAALARLGAVLHYCRPRAYPLAAATAICVASIAGCSQTSPNDPPPPPTSTASSSDALAVYAEFWRLSQLAMQAPRSQDWSVPLATVARSQALDDLLLEVRNYASLSAHVDGSVTVAPQLDPTIAPTMDRVAVLDCIDLSGSRLVSDTGSGVLDDEQNQSTRYRYRAELAREGERWFVERTAPALAEPC